MSSLPSNLARVSNLMTSQMVLGALTRSSAQMAHVQQQLSSGLRINRPSDDLIGASLVAGLDDALERQTQRVRNLDHAGSVLGNVESGLADVSDLVLQAKEIGLSQIGFGSDEETRENQALVIDSLIQELVGVSNRQYQDLYIFSGSSTSTQPIAELLGGYRYAGTGDGLSTDLGLTQQIPITLSSETAFGALSARVAGEADLDPTLDADTRLEDLDGARGFGVQVGEVEIVIGASSVTADLSDAHTVGDVAAALQTAIQTIEAGATVTVDPATSNRFLVDTGAAASIEIRDLGSATIAADLGIASTFTSPSGTGSDLNPLVTEQTEVADLAGLTAGLGSIRLTNAGQSRDLDLSGATTVQEVVNLVHGLNLGVRVEINEDRTGLNFINELSGSEMAISEVGGGDTATQLGVRSFARSTLLADFNDGEGVRIRSGSVDPITGLPDPAADVDFSVTIHDGRSFDVDLAGSETVDDVIVAIEAARDAAGIADTDLAIDLAADGNGLEFTDSTAGASDFSVVRQNTSQAAQDLGIQGSTASATFTGEDRATVAVDSVLTHLITLRDALRGNDEFGIELATKRLDGDVERVVQARATVGVRVQRIERARTREGDRRIQDMALRSQVQDLDFTEAALRFSTLQQQLQATLATAAQVTSLTLLDFL